MWGRSSRIRAMPLVLLLTGLVLLASCARPGVSGQWVWGRQLVLRVGALRFVERVVYQDGGRYYEVRPTSPDRVLAAVLLTVVNQRSARALLLVDQESVSLEDAGGTSYTPLDPFTQRAEVEGPGRRGEVLQPFLWGTLEVPQDYQVSGWLLFEVPQGVRLARLRWEPTETIIVPFQR